MIGLVGLTITATTTMGQLERGLNRIYGVERDRPFVEKYRLAFLLEVSAGAAIAASFVFLAFGRTLGTSGNGAIATIRSLARWTLVSALSIFYDAAVAAQLEAVRAGILAPASVRQADDTPARQRAATAG
ncbi:MAG: YihY/virulence factor BrkB family protein [Thermoleophilia bacterium]|nr:YihY/virulence factor BrkB family protein [Thermoleophilia bacterium]